MLVSEAIRCWLFYTLSMYLILTIFCYERTEKILFILVIEYVAMQWFHQECFDNYVLFEAEIICWWNESEDKVSWCFENYVCLPHQYQLFSEEIFVDSPKSF
uniref:Uncharacterized protein n=1 Tax=Cacopsylla melanoneura TaxID=428564 RepID=A0A8D8RKR5_9HEMI